MAGEMRPLYWRWLGTVPYRDAWSLQQHMVDARRRGDAEDDVVLMLEHPPVYTMGRRGDPSHLGGDPLRLTKSGADFVEVDRGGSVTFHGPGQLVAYPIVRLPAVFPIPGHPAHGDVVRYVRALERAIIATVAAYGISVSVRPPHTGVWSGTSKVASIGVKVSGGVTMHGLAVNVCTDLEWFSRVTACGIEDAGVASLETLGAGQRQPQEVAPVLAEELARALGRHAVPAAEELVPEAALSIRPALARTPVL